MSGDTFFPGSKIPFNPINPHGSRAKMPKGWKNPLARKLYQVHVMDAKHGHLRVGPKVELTVADELCAAMKIAIKAGKISGWTSPTVMPAPPEQVRWGTV